MCPPPRYSIAGGIGRTSAMTPRLHEKVMSSVPGVLKCAAGLVTLRLAYSPQRRPAGVSIALIEDTKAGVNVVERYLAHRHRRTDEVLTRVT